MRHEWKQAERKVTHKAKYIFISLFYSLATIINMDAPCILHLSCMFRLIEPFVGFFCGRYTHC
jgi:hypothetical protein